MNFGIILFRLLTFYIHLINDNSAPSRLTPERLVRIFECRPQWCTCESPTAFYQSLVKPLSPDLLLPVPSTGI